ncbi:hypothetical protein EDC04DRAFT_290682 [Pisolithus marmoratus]|nr:hypothetical protein EDC04DRAFT_290682 [Pisolithus marmoratus]
MRVRDCNGHHRAVPPDLRILLIHSSESLISTYLFCMAILLRTLLAVSWLKLYRSLGTSPFWIGSEKRRCFIAVSLLTSAHIKCYHRLHPNLMLPNQATSQQPTSFKVLRKNVWDRFATSLLPQFLRHSQTPSDVAYHISAVRLRTLDSYAPSDVYDFHSLIRAPLPASSIAALYFHVLLIVLNWFS